MYVEGVPEAKTYINKNNETLPQLSVRVISLSLLSSNKPAPTQESNQEFINQPNGFETTDEIPF